MAGLGQILGGALSGLGDGLEKQTAVNYQNERDQMAERRAIALANLQSQLKTQEQTSQADLNDRNAARDDARGFSYDTQKTAQKQTYEQANIKLKGAVDLSNDQTLEGLKHKYNLSEQAADDARELQKDLTLAGVTVDHWEISSDGKLAAYNKTGHLLTQTMKAGSFNPPRAPKEDDEGGTLEAAKASRGIGGAQSGTPKPAAKPAKTENPDKGRALAALGKAYADASVNPEESRKRYPAMFDANGKLLPKEALIERLNQRYGE